MPCCNRPPVRHLGVRSSAESGKEPPMLRRFKSYARAGCILLVFALFAALVSTAAAFDNGQKASLALGQTTFTTNDAPAASANTMNTPAGVAVDPTSGKVFVADTNNNRVLR